MGGPARDTLMAVESQQPVGLFQRFTVLKGAVRELWIVFIVKFLSIVAYAVMSTTLVLWLSADLGMGDRPAGYWVAAWSTSMTLFTVLVGSLTDAIGLRRAFLLGVWVCIVGRAIMTFTTMKWLALAGLLPLALGEALGAPVMVAATRRYSTTAQRSMAFSVSYAVMNVGFLVSQFIFDFLRKGLGEHGRFTVPWFEVQLSTYRTLFLISFLVQVILWPILYFGLRDGIEATDEGVKITSEQPKYPNENLWSALVLMARDTLRESARIFTGLWQQPGFYRFLTFLALAAFVRLIFLHMTYTYPKFGIRELGEGAPVGRLFGVNSMLIIFLVPLVGALTQKVSAYKMVMVGSSIAAASVFVMTLPPHWFEDMANCAASRWVARHYLGLKDPINPWYMMIFLFIVFLSLGEAVYSPRLYEYAAAIAPKGQEGSYMAMSYLPFFVAKLIVAPFSGVLLDRYCPASGPRDSQTLWLLIGLTTLIAPVGMIAFRRYIRVPEAGRDA